MRSKMENWTLFGLAAELLVAWMSAEAAVYVVDQHSPAATDKGRGTAAVPLKTITAAAKRVQSGDTVRVRNGTYREAVNFPGGTRDKRVVLEAFPEHKPVVKGSEIVPGPWQVAAGLPAGAYTCPWPTYSSLVFCDEERLRQIGVQGNPARLKLEDFTFRKSRAGDGPGDLVPGSFFYDAAAKLLYVWLANGSHPAEHVIEAGVRYEGIRVGAYTTLKGVTVCQVQDGDRKGHMGIRAFGKEIVVESCRVLHCGFFGMTVGGEDCVVRNCEMAYNGNCGFSCALGQRMVFEGNELHHNTLRGGVKCGHSGGLKVVHWKDSKFVRNYIHDEGTHTGLWLDINVENVLVAENRIEDCGCGIYFEISRWGVLANNIIRRCGRGIWLYSSDVLVANNIVDSCGEGITLTGAIRHLSHRKANLKDRRSVYALGSVRNNLIVNNILIDCPGSYVAMTRDTPHAFANFSDYNVLAWTMPAVHNGGNHIKFMAGWDDYYGRLPFWMRARHCDGHSVLADSTLQQRYESSLAWPQVRRERLVGSPAFVNREKADYRLKPDSPLLTRGITVPMALASVCGADGRPWELTRVADAPDPASPEVTINHAGNQHYRIQPEPTPLRLFDLDAQPSAPPGLNGTWIETGQYPRFEIRRRPPGKDSAWYTPMAPDNLIEDPELEQQTKNGEYRAPWEKVNGRVHPWDRVGHIHLLNYARSGLARQQVGVVEPETQYVLTGQMTVHSSLPGVIATGKLYLAAGATMTPAGQVTSATARPESVVGWRYVQAIHVSGKAGEDPMVGQPLYVVLSGNIRGEGISHNNGAPNGMTSWDNLSLLKGRKPVGGAR